MDEYLDMAMLEDWLAVTTDWVLVNVVNQWTLLQLVLLVLLWLLARPLGRLAGPHVEARLARLKLKSRLEPLRDRLVELMTPLLFLLLLWLAIGVMHQLTWPSRSYILGVVASLMTAWIVIRLGASFIHNPAMARLLASGAWCLAALNITGLLEPTVKVLDALAIDFGELRISLLTVVQGVIALALLLWAASSASRLLEARINRVSDLSPSVQVLLGKLLRITLLTLAIVIALNMVGIDLTALALFSGAVGVGIGFGLQKVVSNLISGVILLLDKSIKPGDVIELGDTFGWITSLGARYVSVVTRDGKEYLIPNEDLITQQVVNWSYSDQLVRMEIGFGVSYDCDPHEVRRIAREAAAEPDRVSSDRAPVCHLVGFGDSSLDFLLRFWIRDPQGGVANVKGEVLLALWDAFKAHGIEIPYPHRQLIVPDPIRIDGGRPGTTEPAAAGG